MWLRSALGKALGSMFPANSGQAREGGRKGWEIEMCVPQASFLMARRGSCKDLRVKGSCQTRLAGARRGRTLGQAACRRDKGKAHGVGRLGFKPYRHHRQPSSHCLSLPTC